MCVGWVRFRQVSESVGTILRSKKRKGRSDYIAIRKEIDECLLHRRKYNVGRLKQSGWVLGGIERPTTETGKPKMFLECCPNRKKETLEGFIKKWVLPETIIITDCFKGYLNLSNLGSYHFTVNHAREFVAASGAHTQRIEGMWHWVRRLAIPINTAKLTNLDLYLSAFLYRRFVNGNILTFIKELGTITRSEILHEEKCRNVSSQEETQGNLPEAERKQAASPTHSVQPDSASLPNPERGTSEERILIGQLVLESRFTSPRKLSHTLQKQESSTDSEDTSTESSSNQRRAGALSSESSASTSERRKQARAARAKLRRSFHVATWKPRRLSPIFRELLQLEPELQFSSYGRIIKKKSY